MNRFSQYIIALALLLNAFATNAQVVINEFCIANYSNWALTGEYEDWVEFYNPTGAAVNIGNYYLSDDPTDPTKWQIPVGYNIPANGYRVILLSGTGDYDPSYLGQNNTNFKITQTNGESIVFADATGAILEEYTFGTGISPSQANHSWGRIPNGSATWLINTAPTPNAANAGISGTSYSPKPQLSLQAGYYAAPISLTMTSAEAGATIYYTTNGSVPTTASTLYTGPINLNTTTTIRARAFSADGNVLASFVETNTYFFGADQHNIMVATISGPTLSDGQWGGDELTVIEFFGPGGVFLSESHGDSNEHGNDSNAYDQRGFDYVTRDALGYDNVVPTPLFHHSDRPSYERLIFKAAANDNYPFGGGAHIRDAYVCELSLEGDLHLDERKTESCIVYINAAYWGVYEVREKVDDIDYTDYYYDQPEGFVDFIKTWGGTWNEYGSNADWNTLVNFITTNDMTIPANYDYVLTQYNHMSLIDYFILNGYVVCTDWLNWNTAWWRGRHPQGDARRWRYALWDNDATFGHYINYTGVPSQGATADPCQIDGMGDVGGQGHIPVLNALFDNENFFADYIQRYASLSNSIFSCERMIAVLDSMVAVIEPEMTRHCQRWGGNLAGWQAQVQQLRDFINDRCNNEIITGIEDCYDVTAVNLTVQIDGAGEVDIEDIVVSDLNDPWTGIFFADLPIDIEALVNDGGGSCGSFIGWEIISGTGTITDPTAIITQISISTDVTLVAHFAEPATGPITIMTDMSDPGAGVVTINGVDLAVYPSSADYTPGATMTLDVVANEWFTFNHWETNHAIIDPDDAATTITLQPCVPDTIIAVFDFTPNAQLTVMVEPAGAGTVQMNASVLDPLPFTDQLEADLDYTFITNPTDVWSVFDHWELNHHVLTPDEFSTNVTLHFMEDDTLVAVYTIIPHHDVTIMVEPAYSGRVVYGNNWSTEVYEERTIEGEVATPFKAFPDEFWNFVEYRSTQGNVISLNSASEEVNITFFSADTIIAVFEKEPFTWYFPNSFTPNDDGLNDVFIPQGNAIDPNSYEMYIFNRWGEVVFQTNDINQPWDGSHQNGDYYVNDQVYVYRVKLKSVFDNDFKEYSGTITVFR